MGGITPYLAGIALGVVLYLTASILLKSTDPSILNGAAQVQVRNGTSQAIHSLGSKLPQRERIIGIKAKQFPETKDAKSLTATERAVVMPSNDANSVLSESIRNYREKLRSGSSGSKSSSNNVGGIPGIAASVRTAGGGGDADATKEYFAMLKTMNNGNVVERSDIDGEGEGERSDKNDPAQRCKEMKEDHMVVPGASWGTLSIAQQRLWTLLQCDKLVSAGLHAIDSHKHEDHTEEDAAAVSKPGTSTTTPATKTPTTGAVSQLQLQQDKKEAREKKKAWMLKNAALPSVKQTNAEWCVQARRTYKVQPMKSWGELPRNQIDRWKELRCDLVFTAMRMGKKALSSCNNYKINNNSTSTSTTTTAPAGSSTAGQITSISSSLSSLFGAGKSKKSGDDNNNNNQLQISSSSSSTAASTAAAAAASKSMPLIALMAASTTRKVTNPSTNNLALFMYLLPSVVRTIDCGFRYIYILGYDKGDPFYDNPEGMEEVKKWFQKNIERPMKRNGISITLHIVRVNNTLKKPGPVFLEMARAAYKLGADYFYRVNDDTELLDNWPTIFVNSLQSLHAPYGVVGPYCGQGNQRILTHDFTARVHMEIFEMNYYPPELVDWWMDDWISIVYGKERTFKARSAPVIHHTGAHGQRYQVDQANANKLDDCVRRGREKIRAWMLKHNVPESDLKKFDHDQFKVGLIRFDTPDVVAAGAGAGKGVGIVVRRRTTTRTPPPTTTTKTPTVAAVGSGRS